MVYLIYQRTGGCFNYMCNYIVKIRNTCRDEYRIILTPKLTGKNEARDFVKNKYFNKYDDVIVEICAIVDLRDKEVVL